MITCMKASFRLICGAFLGLGIPSFALANDTLVAIGKVGSTGTLQSASNGVGGTVLAQRVSAGSYLVSVGATGAFAGLDEDNVVIEATLETSSSGDRAIGAKVASVSADMLQVAFSVADLQGSTTPDAAVAVDNAFSFAIRRLSVGSGRLSGVTPLLFSAGRINVSGATATVRDQFTAGEGILSVQRTSAGQYEITVSEAGAFASDGPGDYPLFLGLTSSAPAQDQVISGHVSDISSDDEVTFVVSIRDAQDDGTNPDDGNPEDDPFNFAIYRLTSPNLPTPETRFIHAIASFDGATEVVNAFEIASDGSIFGGVSYNFIRSGAGRYTLSIIDFFAYEGRSADSFAPFAYLRQAGSAHDLSPHCDAVLVSDSTLEIHVSINDLEQSGNSGGVAADAPFSIVVYDVDPKARPDLRVGLNAAATTGNNRYNNDGYRQSVNVPVKAKGTARFFVAAQNDGTIFDTLPVRLRSVPKTVAFTCVTVSPRANVTAAVRAGTAVAENTLPGRSIVYEGRLRFRSPKRLSGGRLSFRTTSTRNAPLGDTGIASFRKPRAKR